MLVFSDGDACNNSRSSRRAVRSPTSIICTSASIELRARHRFLGPAGTRVPQYEVDRDASHRPAGEESPYGGRVRFKECPGPPGLIAVLGVALSPWLNMPAEDGQHACGGWTTFSFLSFCFFGNMVAVFVDFFLLLCT
jgi:hypothetical protein